MSVKDSLYTATPSWEEDSSGILSENTCGASLGHVESLNDTVIEKYDLKVSLYELSVLRTAVSIYQVSIFYILTSTLAKAVYF